jgi:hypothetical protein
MREERREGDTWGELDEPATAQRFRSTKSSAAAGEAGRRLQRIVIPLSLQVITLKFHFGRSFDYPDSRSRYMKR